MNENYSKYLDYLEEEIVEILYKIFKTSPFSSYNKFHNFYFDKIKTGTSFYLERLIVTIKPYFKDMGVSDNELDYVLRKIFKNKL